MDCWGRKKGGKRTGLDRGVKPGTEKSTKSWEAKGRKRCCSRAKGQQRSRFAEKCNAWQEGGEGVGNDRNWVYSMKRVHKKSKRWTSGKSSGEKKAEGQGQ